MRKTLQNSVFYFVLLAFIISYTTPTFSASFKNNIITNNVVKKTRPVVSNKNASSTMLATTTLTLKNSYTISGSVSEPSGLAYDKINNQLFSVSDSDDIYRLSTTGQLLDTYDFSGDLEGVVVYGPNTLLVAIEDTYKLVEYNYVTGATTNHTMNYSSKGDSGSGIEGVTYNPTTGEIYFLNKKDPAALIVANSSFNVTNEYVLNFAGDLSAASYEEETGYLWLGSDEESTVYICTTNGTVIETIPVKTNGSTGSDLDKLEGIAVDHDNHLLYVVTDGGGKLYVFNIVTENPIENIAPYDIVRFQNYLAQCKLQSPLSGTEATDAEIIEGYSSSTFYVADTDKIAFYQTRNSEGTSQRTELRFLENWYISGGDQTLHANLKIVQQTCDELTVLQIHDDANLDVNPSGPNKPLLRIYQLDGKISAAIKTDAGGVSTTKIDLGSTPSGYFDCDISIESGRLIIKYNGVEKVNKDVSYWTYPSYWKNGVYLQDPGEALVYFNELTLATSAIPVLGVSLDPSEATIPQGSSQQLTATLNPSNTNNQGVSYSSNNTSVATVDQSGLVTAVSEGSATITVTTDDGGFTDTSAITVIAPSLVTNLALNKPITGTGTADGSNVVANLVDGSTATRWSVLNYPQTAIINLGAVYKLESTELVCYDGRAYQFTVAAAVTEDGTYTEIVNRSANTTPGTDAAPITNYFPSFNAQYVKITISNADADSYTGDWVSLSEFRVFGSEITLGFNDEGLTQDDLVSLWPNPATNIININGNNIFDSLQVYNQLGKLILHQEIQGSTIDVSNLTPGLYFFKLSGNNKTINQRIIIK